MRSSRRPAWRPGRSGSPPSASRVPAPAHRDTPPSCSARDGRVVELPLGIKAGSLVLTGSACCNAPAPPMDLDRGWFEPGRTAGNGGSSFGPAGTRTASSWSSPGPRTSGQQRAGPGATGYLDIVGPGQASNRSARPSLESLHTAEVTGSILVAPTSENTFPEPGRDGACQKICQKATGSATARSA